MLDGSSDTTRSLHVSGIFGGGTANQHVEAAIFDLARIVAREETLVPPTDDPLLDGVVDVTYIVSGTIWQPEHEGIRTGRFLRKKRLLVVQVAVPSPVGDTVQAREFVAAALRESVARAAEYFASKGLGLSTTRAEALARRAAAQLVP